MKTNNTDDLKVNGFSIEKTKDVNTIITHNKPFKLVREGKADFAVPLNEDTGKYSVTIGGYPDNGQISYDVVQYTTPLLVELNEAANRNVAEQAISDDNDAVITLKSVVFEDVAVNADFFKSEDGSGVKYVKVDETTYVKAGNTIGASIELVASKSDTVFVAEMFEDDITSLSVEQKKNIVDHAPEGLSPDDFAEYVGHDLENIPGLESLDDDDLDQLIQSLSHMYFNQ